MSKVLEFKRPPKPQREPWRDAWETAFTVKRLIKELAQLPQHARVYVRTEKGIAGVVDFHPYTSEGGGCYGQPTIILFINAGELTP